MNEDRDGIVPVPDRPLDRFGSKLPEKGAETGKEQLGIPKEQKDGLEKGLERPQQQVAQTLTKENPGKGAKSWLKDMGWSGSPFTFTILPELFVGYNEQTQSISTMLEEKHKIILLVGPTGSGKTTLLKWVSERLPKGFDSIFVGKPPEKPDEFVDIFNEKFKRPWYLRWIMPNIKNIHQILSFIENEYLLMKILMDFSDDKRFMVKIGTELFDEGLNNLSLVASKYQVKGNASGTIGVLGPKRMDYSRVINILDLFRKSLSDIFGHA